MCVCARARTRGCVSSDAQSCPTLSDSMDYNPSGSSVHGIPRQEHCSGLLFPSPGDLPDPEIEPVSLASPALAGGLFTTVPPLAPARYQLEKN